jgi:transcriptional regulator with XRE-family HTH domain
MEELSLKLKQRRGNRGIREVAREIGIGHATLSRIESGKQPDLQTFTKICKWLEIDPNSVLGFERKTQVNNNHLTVTAHFRAEKTMSPTTAQHLAELILAVQKATVNET